MNNNNININTEIFAVSPIDGRYRKSVKELADYFSEYALIKYRIYIEIEYFIYLTQYLPELQNIGEANIALIRDIYNNYGLKDAKAVKNIEKKTNHDVKSVEYHMRNKFDEIGLSQYKEYIHFGLTSQDINSSANMLQIMLFIREIYTPNLTNLCNLLSELSTTWFNIPMLSRTHGQPATPTLLGKEILVYCERLNNEIEILNKIDYSTKFGGAVGNMNAHYVACPEVDWITFANNFAMILGLSRNKYTTQIDHYDNYARIFDNLRRINVILIDLSRDVWMYISQNYFSQKIHQNEVGSSAMPHKVNPINFENAEGNLMLANTLFDFMSNKLPISRLQRDLTDSTVLRNVGVSFAHTLTSIKSLVKGFNRIDVNMDMIQNDLGNNWMVIAEAIQTILRRSGYVNAYDALRNYTRVETNMTKEKMDYFINNLQIDNVLKEKLLSITPYNYYGYIV